jgi:hypothetical protein
MMSAAFDALMDPNISAALSPVRLKRTAAAADPPILPSTAPAALPSWA